MIKYEHTMLQFCQWNNLAHNRSQRFNVLLFGAKITFWMDLVKANVCFVFKSSIHFAVFNVMTQLLSTLYYVFNMTVFHFD